MSKVFDAINNKTVTTNGMAAHKSTLDANLDLFFKIGTARGQDMSNEFKKAFNSNQDIAIRTLLWARDVRGGAGERQRFRDLLLSFVGTGEDGQIEAIIRKIPEVGRFDDLHIFMGTAYQDYALQTHAAAIKDGNGLAAKWAPRKGKVAQALRETLGLTPKGYRKTVVNLTKVVEQQMCSNQWDEIEYSHVPSVASKIYSRAFKKHDESRYSEYLEAVMSGEKKMNASAIFPHDVVKGLNSNADQANAQWKSLPNYLEGVDERILTVCDVSGSMYGMPMDVSISLGLYFSERLNGVFKDCVVTFTDVPDFVKITGKTLRERVNNLGGINWGMSTNLEAVFKVLLKNAVAESVPQEEMPTKLLIISDMQFNQGVKGGDKTALEMIKKSFKKAGYEMPQVIFWNVANESHGNVPVKMNEEGVALVSGASPAVIQSVLGGTLSPMQVMLDTVMKERYNY